LVLAAVLPAAASGDDTRVLVRPASSAPTGLKMSVAELATFDVFETFVRYSAERRFFQAMTAETAYYRDVFVGGETFHDNPSEGDTISAQLFAPPSGALVATWDPFVYHLDFNGQHNCWVSAFNGYICGVSGIDVIWYRQSQCGETGTYTMKFLRNGAVFHTGTFKLLPRIPPDAIPTTYNQGSYLDGYDEWCYTVNAQGNRIAGTNHTCNDPMLANERQYTIKAKGCYLSDTAMVLNYHGVTGFDPPGLNDALNGVTGGYQSGAVNPREVAHQGTLNGVRMTFLGGTNDLYNAICRYGPVLLGVHCNARNQAGHWVLATGRDDNKTTWQIGDPNGGVNTTLAARYGNTYCGTRVFSGPEYSFTTSSGIVVKFHSPVELLIVDPLGRRLGFDPLTGQSFEEIPGAYYEAGGLDDDETGEPDDDPTKTLYLPTPAVGGYALNVTGTGDGTYSSEFQFYDRNGAVSESDLRDIPIATGQVQKITFTYSDAAGAQTKIEGGFNGGGQRPRDVNRFLSYGNPGDSPVSLAAGTTTFPLLVFYAPSTIPSSFSAVLNGADVTAMFHPQAGGGEIVNLPLVPGSNVLKLSIDGNLPTRVATDSDRLVFSVQ
jgi:hypothetical protein